MKIYCQNLISILSTLFFSQNILGADEFVNLSNLIKSPSMYEGKQITTEGILQIKFEDDHLSYGKDILCIGTYDEGPFTKENLDRHDRKREKWAKLNKQMVRITAIFLSEGCCHGGCIGGNPGLMKIKKIENVN